MKIVFASVSGDVNVNKTNRTLFLENAQLFA